MADDIHHRADEDLHKTHADYFQIAPEGDFVALSFGEVHSELDDDGRATPSEVVYDTKVKMTAETLRTLRDFIDDVLDTPEDDDRHIDRGVQ